MKLSEGEIKILLMGLSYCPTPKNDITKFEEDLFWFTRKIRLKYHWAVSQTSGNSTQSEEPPSLVKLPSTFTPKRGIHKELEKVLQPIERLNIFDANKKDNLKHNRRDLISLKRKTDSNEIVIKPADKGDMIVIQEAADYRDMCQRHLSDIEYYVNLGPQDPSMKVQEKVVSFANKYKNMLTTKEHHYLTESNYKMANFYMLPKLHKNKELNEILSLGESPEYLQIKLNTPIEGRPIISGPAYHTSGISKILHFIMQPVLEKIKHVLKDTFDFVERFDRKMDDETLIITWDIKSLYPNIRHDLFYEAISYWVDRYAGEIPLLQRFSKDFILDALWIILKFNYAYYDKDFYHQIKGTATGTTFAVVGANLVVAYKEVQLFVLLPELFPRDFVEWFISNYFRFLDDICHKWLKRFDLDVFATALNGMDVDLQFIMDMIRDETHYLDVNMYKEKGVLYFDIYYKPTNAFGYLRYSSSHPKHTINNIALSLGKRIVRIVSENRGKRLDELKYRLMNRDHPEDVIKTALVKLFQPENKSKSDQITFVHTYNPGHRFEQETIVDCLKQSNHYRILEVFNDTEVVVGTRQPNNLRKILTKARFELVPEIRYKLPAGIYPCGKCTYCDRGYIKNMDSFTVKGSNNYETQWKFSRHFNCNSKNILYVCINKNDDDFYLGKTKNAKQRVSKHISDVGLPENSMCREFSEHVRNTCNMIEPFFTFIPFYYVEDDHLRDFMEKRFIRRFKPTLNGNNTV